MTGTKKRKRYNASEKAKIALDAIKGELTIAEITTKYSVHSTQINAWKKQVLEQLPEAFSNAKKQEQADQEAMLSKLY